MIERDEILKRWFYALKEVFPPDRQILLEKKGERFSNPFRAQIEEGLNLMLDGLFENKNSLIEKGLNLILSLLALENLRPSQALSFLLKARESTEIGEEIMERMVFKAFDIYMEFREKLYELKIKALRSKQT